MEILLNYTHEETEEEFRLLTNIPKAEFTVLGTKKRKGGITGLSNDKVTVACNKLSFSDLLRSLTIILSHDLFPFKTHQNNYDFSVNFYHRPMFIAGRYNKYQRNISNSVWIIDGKLHTKDSIESLISTHLKDTFRNDGILF